MKDKALRQALEFLEQLGENHWGNRPDVITTIKEALAQRTWINLTDDEIKEIIGSWGDTPIKGYTRQLMDQIQNKLKEKNG